jgi:diguanylate cyclase (GGDEF)-like protein
MIDINDLGHINDTHGHFAGDLAIKEVIKRLRSYHKNFVIGRYGGDEFLMLLTNTNAFQARKIKKENEKLVSTAEIKTTNNSYSLSISQGLAEVKYNERVENVLQRVFKDLTTAKLKQKPA